MFASFSGALRCASIQRSNYCTRNIVTGLNALKAPIHLFSVREFGISTEVFTQEHKELFRSLPPDLYDLRKNQLEFFHTQCPGLISDKRAKEYYLNGEWEILDQYYQSLSPELKEKFDLFRPYRYRAVSKFEVIFTPSGPKISRQAVEPFTQDSALIENADDFDYRKLPRVFAELPDSATKLSSFDNALLGVAEKIRFFVRGIKGVSMVLHHVRVSTHADQPADNSPEGIHQDGFPFIVSALVVERENINGGVSVIYAEDKITQLFTTELAPGMGLMQPDLGSPLWHKVTTFEVDKSTNPEAKEGHRSSIGFDIQPIY